MIITTGNQAWGLLDDLVEHDLFGIDCETDGIDPRKDPAAGPLGQIVYWSIAFGDRAEVIEHNPNTQHVFDGFLKRAPVVGHNIYGFDRHMFRKANMPLGNIVGDTLRMSQLLNPDDDAEHGLKSLMKWHLGWEPVGDFEDLFTRRKGTYVPDISEEIVERKRTIEGNQVLTLAGGPSTKLGKGRETIPLREIALEYPHLLPTLEAYAALDAKATLCLYRMFQATLKNTPWTPPLYQGSGLTPAALSRTWKPRGAASTSTAVRPRTQWQPPICTR